MFSALVVSEATDGFEAAVREVDEADLPDGDVTVDVEYSSINYKDALAIINGKPVLRQFPMVPGIDFAGTVSASRSDEWSVGDAVVLDGWGVGEERWGGLAQKARVDGSWLVPVPDGWSTRDAMAVGTAGFTAALAVGALDDHGLTAPGPVLVTGASGGVGSFAILLLAAGGINAIAASRTPDAASYLTSLGASEIIDSTELGTDVRALGKQRWWGAIDNVGGSVLAGAISSTTAGGAVAACGNAGGMDLPTTVAPFILRGVSLLGIDSVRIPREARLAAWAMLAARVPRERLEEVTAEVGLAEVVPTAARLLANDLTGRVVVDLRR
jgi:acrylyl-CoA reductase (NADPH)